MASIYLQIARHARLIFVAVWRVLLLITLLSGCGTRTVAVPPTAAMPQQQGKLSARLQMLADHALSGADNDTQARALGLPETGPGSLARNDTGAVLVVVRVSDVSTASMDAIEAAGVVTTNVATPFRSVTGYIHADQLVALAALPVVENVREELLP